MKTKLFVHTLVFLFFIKTTIVCAFSSDSTNIDSLNLNRVNPRRLAVVGGVTVFTYGYVYYYMKTQAWWKENPVPFHFDSGRDRVYALGHDKLGHLLGGIIVSDRMGTLLNWSGIKSKNAILYGAIWSSVTQFVVEVKDAYAPTYGFSWRDATWGTIGSFYPYLKSKSKFFESTEVKFSFYPRQFGPIIDPKERKRSATWHDDYINQTYWFSINLKSNLPFLRQTNFPNWLNLAIGASLDQNTDGFGKGNREWLISLDIDTKKLFKPKRLFWKTVVNSLVYVKVPAPSIQFGRNVPFKFYPLYF